MKKQFSTPKITPIATPTPKVATIDLTKSSDLVKSANL